METIPVVVDKSHLLTIGTRLYTESLDLIRELVANAYDADATEARISFLGNMGVGIGKSFKLGGINATCSPIHLGEEIVG